MHIQCRRDLPELDSPSPTITIRFEIPGPTPPTTASIVPTELVKSGGEIRIYQVQNCSCEPGPRRTMETIGLPGGWPT